MKSMTGRAVVLAIFLAISLFGCARSAHLTTSAAKPQATPTPTPTRCWILDRIYPVTDLALNAQKATPAERHEIKAWASRVSPDKRSLVRWIRDQRDKRVLIFVAEPELPGTQIAWIALNTNLAIDVHQCAFYAVPGA